MARYRCSMKCSTALFGRTRTPTPRWWVHIHIQRHHIIWLQPGGWSVLKGIENEIVLAARQVRGVCSLFAHVLPRLTRSEISDSVTGPKCSCLIAVRRCELACRRAALHTRACMAARPPPVCVCVCMCIYMCVCVCVCVSLHGIALHRSSNTQFTHTHHLSLSSLSKTFSIF